jgi:nucleotide-binding universal stress UspA family protein
VKRYKRVGVASTFSPRFFAVLTEADRFARHFGAELEIIHAADEDPEKEAVFQEALGRLERLSKVRWAQGTTPAEAIISSVVENECDLLVAGALVREDEGTAFTNAVARTLLASCPCDLLLLPRPIEDAAPLRHVAFIPERDQWHVVEQALEFLKPRQVTLLAAESPFAAAIASTRGEAPIDPEEEIATLEERLRPRCESVESRVVRTNTGFTLCDVIQGLEADLLVVSARCENGERQFPGHLDWLRQVIPTRVLTTCV